MRIHSGTLTTLIFTSALVRSLELNVLGSGTVFHDVSCKILQSCLVEEYGAIFLVSKILLKFLLAGQIIEPSFFMYVFL